MLKIIILSAGFVGMAVCAQLGLAKEWPITSTVLLLMWVLEGAYSIEIALANSKYN